MSIAPTRTFTGRHMLIIMLAFFSVVFAANFTMAYFAYRSWTGLVVKNSYVASQEFNETTDRLEKAARGVSANITYANQRLTITLNAKNGAPVSASNVRVLLGRPSHQGEDQEIALAAEGNGVFSAAHYLAKGQWAGDISADVIGHENWLRPVRIIVQD